MNGSRVSTDKTGNKSPMIAALRSAGLSYLVLLLAVIAGATCASQATAQDDPFSTEPAKPADAPAAEPRDDDAPAIIRKVEEPSIRKMELLPYQRKDLMQRLIKEIQAHLDAKENAQAAEKLDELLEVQMTDSELRDLRRRFSRFLIVEVDQRVLEMRRRKPTGAINLMEAIRRMIEIDRVDEARKYLAQLTANKLTPKENNEVYGLVGESYLRGLIRDQKLGAVGAEFAQNVIDAATSRTTSNSPVVQALRSTRLNTPADQLDSIEKLLRYGALSDAQEIAEQLAKREMTPDEMAELHRQVGSGPLLMLVREKRLGEAASAFGQKVLDASSLIARDPTRLAEAANKYLSGDLAAKRAAAKELARGGEASAAALLKIPSTDANSTQIEKALADLGDAALAPLTAALHADAPPVRELAARALARMGNVQGNVVLLSAMHDERTSASTRAVIEEQLRKSAKTIPSREAALLRLRQEWDRAFDDLRPGVVALDTPTFEWIWSSEKKELVHQLMTVGQARRWKLARAGIAMLEVAPNDLEVGRLAAISIAEAATADAPGYLLAESEPWARSMLEKLSIGSMEQGLAEGVQRQRIFALLGLLQAIAKVGDESLLIPTAGQPRIVTKLLGHAHPRVRAQAVETVLQLTPTTTFAGSSQLLEALRGFSQLRARPSVVVVDPKPSRAQKTGMLLRQAGWEAEVFLNEAELTRRVASLTDAQIVLVSEETTNVMEFLQRIRREPKFALTPVGVMADVDNLPGADFVAGVMSRPKSTALGGVGMTLETLLPVGIQNAIDDPRQTKAWLDLDRITRVVPYALNEDVLARIVLQLSQLQSDAPLSPDDQINLAIQSVRWMGYIASNDNLARIFDLGAVETEAVAALNHDLLAIDAATVVGFLGTAKCQEALVNLASQNQRELSVRKSAAEAFKAAVEKRGLLLTQGAIGLQYDRYNQSRDADEAIRTVLGSVLDAIEIPWKKRQAVSAAEPR
jgi:hypothetical protein